MKCNLAQPKENQQERAEVKRRLTEQAHRIKAFTVPQDEENKLWQDEVFANSRTEAGLTGEKYTRRFIIKDSNGDEIDFQTDLAFLWDSVAKRKPEARRFPAQELVPIITDNLAKTKTSNRPDTYFKGSRYESESLSACEYNIEEEQVGILLQVFLTSSLGEYIEEAGISSLIQSLKALISLCDMDIHIDTPPEHGDQEMIEINVFQCYTALWAISKLYKAEITLPSLTIDGTQPLKDLLQAIHKEEGAYYYEMKAATNYKDFGLAYEKLRNLIGGVCPSASGTSWAIESGTTPILVAKKPVAYLKQAAWLKNGGKLSETDDNFGGLDISPDILELLKFQDTHRQQGKAILNTELAMAEFRYAIETVDASIDRQKAAILLKQANSACIEASKHQKKQLDIKCLHKQNMDLKTENKALIRKTATLAKKVQDLTENLKQSKSEIAELKASTGACTNATAQSYKQKIAELKEIIESKSQENREQRELLDQAIANQASSDGTGAVGGTPGDMALANVAPLLSESIDKLKDVAVVLFGGDMMFTNIRNKGLDNWRLFSADSMPDIAAVVKKSDVVVIATSYICHKLSIPVKTQARLANVPCINLVGTNLNNLCNEILAVVEKE